MRIVPLLFSALLLLPVLAAGEVTAKPEPIRVETHRLEKGSALFVVNSSPGSCVVTLDVLLKDATASKETPLTLSLKAGENVEVLKVLPQSPTRPWSFNYSFKCALGKLNAKHDPETVYVLPYPAGMAYTVAQGFNGTFSHTGEMQYAIDFAMPEGSTVCAARAGKVVALKIDSNVGGDDRVKFFDKGNFIAIEHEDGTVGHYFHLKQNGASVKLGQAVKAGENIGLSGATGFASEPHLHFHVQIPLDGKSFKTVPMKFMTAGGTAIEVEKDQSYTAATVVVPVASEPAKK